MKSENSRDALSVEDKTDQSGATTRQSRRQFNMEVLKRNEDDFKTKDPWKYNIHIVGEDEELGIDVKELK